MMPLPGKVITEVEALTLLGAEEIFELVEKVKEKKGEM
ncbi:hypothetical protein ig2599ANME_0536 [groundwater metagenome]